MKHYLQIEKVKKAVHSLSFVSSSDITDMLHQLADTLLNKSSNIIEANKKDLAALDELHANYYTFQITENDIKNLASTVRRVANLPTPIGELIESRNLANGLKIDRIRVPLGVIGILSEVSPQLLIKAFTLTVRSGNGCIYLGNRETANTEKILLSIIHDTLKKNQFEENITQQLPAEDKSRQTLLGASEHVDLLIPIGSKTLVAEVLHNSKIPVIPTGSGVVHIYIDATADFEQCREIIFNAKSPDAESCTSLDCVLIHESVLEELPYILSHMAEINIEVHADQSALEHLTDNYPESMLFPASEDTYGSELPDNKIAIKTVSSIEEAVEHIALFGAKQSEAIISEDPFNIQQFINDVDAAIIYVNASTAFTNGEQLGLGTEIGISSTKLHARGPIALRELTGYKWIVKGNGHIKPLK